MTSFAPEEHKNCCNNVHMVPAQQTLDELSFERGIWCAAMNGDYAKVEKFLSKGVNAGIMDSSGYTSLHYAARNGHKEICKLLLKHGANVNAQTPGGATPLHRASFQGHVDIVKVLIDHFCNLSLCDSDKKTALHKAAERSHYEVAKLLITFNSALKYETDLREKLPLDYVVNNNKELLDLLK